MLMKHIIKANKDAAQDLDLIPNSNDGIWAKDKEGQAKPEHTYWADFKDRMAKGLRFEKLAQGK